MARQGKNIHQHPRDSLPPSAMDLVHLPTIRYNLPCIPHAIHWLVHLHSIRPCPHCNLRGLQGNLRSHPHLSIEDRIALQGRLVHLSRQRLVRLHLLLAHQRGLLRHLLRHRHLLERPSAAIGAGLTGWATFVIGTCTVATAGS